MTEARWNRTKVVFHAASALEPDHRRAFLEALEPDLRAEVESLLANDQDDSFLADEGPDLQLGDPRTFDRATPLHELRRMDTPDRIDAYRILRGIGEGGMGVVYEAEQQEPVRRKVALKLIKWGMDTKQVIARFESERQALALMNHPNIASVFDAGTTPEGRPYFVMEYVQGIPITEYCDTHRLPIKKRLQLFIQVCEGVQHAHQKGIIHRDIKPTNVLVAVPDDKPVAKIIDFGVAKATSQRLTEHTVATELGQLIGTPEYMSPEQAEMTNLDIDTRTDVYSLGVLLYELLVGAQPFDSKELRKAGLSELQRRLREQVPPKPSTRVSSLGALAATSADNRGMEAKTLSKLLSGDLDRITMKAMEKDRVRRYETPNALALDVTRFLGHQPIRARSPSVFYRTGKFVRRNRLGVLAGATVMAALLFALFSVSRAMLQARRAHAEAAREAAVSEQAVDFLVGLFEVADPTENDYGRLTVEEILERGVRDIDDALDGDPHVGGRLSFALGRAYTNLGRYVEAEKLLQKALEAQSTTLGREHVRTLRTMGELGDLYWHLGRTEDAESLYRQVAATANRVLGPTHRETLEAGSRLGSAYYAHGRLDESAELLSKTLRSSREILGPEHELTVQVLSNLGSVIYAKGDYRAAEPLMREALAGRQKLLGETHPGVLTITQNLAHVLLARGELDEAESLTRDVLAKRREALGVTHPNVSSSLAALANVLLERGEYDEAESLMLETLAMNRELYGDRHTRVGVDLSRLGRLYDERGEHERAATLHEDASAILEGTLEPGHWRLATIRAAYGANRMFLNRFEDAEKMLLESFQQLDASLGREHRNTQEVVRAVVDLYDAWDRPEPALEYRSMLLSTQSVVP